MTRNQMIKEIIFFANMKPSIRKLANMPLENLQALYTWLFYGEIEDFEQEEV